MSQKETPNRWALVKCQCGNEHCDRHTVESNEYFGIFYQGCGWSKSDAQKIADKLNRSDKSKPKLTPRQIEALRWAVGKASEWYGAITGDLQAEVVFMQDVEHACQALEALGITVPPGTRIDR
jgi:hypothetical protein